MNHFNIKALALSIGITWAIFCLILGWASTYSWCGHVVYVLSSVYVGYQPGFIGGIVGAFWGFINGAISGIVIALFYNCFTRKRSFRRSDNHSTQRRKKRR